MMRETIIRESSILNGLNFRLHLITADGTYSSMDYRYVVTASKGLTSLDPACVAVIDNCRIFIHLAYLQSFS